MEDMIEVLFVLIAIGASLVSTAIKAGKKNKAAIERHQAASRAAQAPAKAEPHPYAPAVQPMMPVITPADVPGPVIFPTVHAHVQPDCETHDKPGSLGVTSLEGKDPCHEDELTLERTFDEPALTENGLTFDWSGQNMVKAFVMQEILTRPAQRRRA
ncbi:MAG: hypothetical protein IJA83_12175 [Clostridia bacterium]|nr:hypothetical protein [Clostridia bacterium]